MTESNEAPETVSHGVERAREDAEIRYARENAYTPGELNEDGSISDRPAQIAQERAYAQAAVPPNKRPADDHTAGTPAWMEEHSPAHLHSDGGSTLAPETDSLLANVDQRDLPARSPFYAAGEQPVEEAPEVPTGTNEEAPTPQEDTNAAVEDANGSETTDVDTSGPVVEAE